MEQKNWREIFRVERTIEKGPAIETDHAHDHPACLRAKGFKCVCKCCGARHGELARVGMSPLENYGKAHRACDLSPDLSEIEQIFADTWKGIHGPIEYTRAVVRSLL